MLVAIVYRWWNVRLMHRRVGWNQNATTAVPPSCTTCSPQKITRHPAPLGGYVTFEIQVLYVCPKPRSHKMQVRMYEWYKIPPWLALSPTGWVYETTNCGIGCKIDKRENFESNHCATPDKTTHKKRGPALPFLPPKSTNDTAQTTKYRL